MVKTILIKLSGESLAGEFVQGLDFKYIEEICLRIKKIHDMGIRVAIVCGGGNFIRGRDTTEMDRVTADYVGMMATIMNSLVLKSIFNKIGCDVYNQSGLSVSMIDDIDQKKILSALDNGKIVIFGGGVGKPYFSTDTGAALRARDALADVIVKLTNVDGVYDKDPDKYDDAIMYGKVTFDEVISKKLAIMDLEAVDICRENNINIVVTNINNSSALLDIVNGKIVGTLVCNN